MANLQTNRTGYEIRICTGISDTLNATPIVVHKQYKEAAVYVYTAIKKVSDVLGVNLQDDIITVLTEDVIDKYKHDSIEDILFCLKKGRRGYYGNNYGKLNLIVISEWMTKYLEEKATARERSLSKVKEKPDEIDYEQYKRRIKQQPKKKDDFGKFVAGWIRSRQQSANDSDEQHGNNDPNEKSDQ